MNMIRQILRRVESSVNLIEIVLLPKKRVEFFHSPGVIPQDVKDRLKRRQRSFLCAGSCSTNLSCALNKWVFSFRPHAKTLK